MKKIIISRLTLLIALLSIGLLFGCSGGGSSDNSSPTIIDNGTVALYLKDGPADEYDSIIITIIKIALLPVDSDDDSDHGKDGDDDGEMEVMDGDEDDNHAAPVIIFESETGEEVDLLAYRDEPYLFLVDDSIPAGEYAKIRLWISDVKPVGGPCEEMEIKLPSGKIDLNPRGGFEVVPGEALAIELDIDLDKSIQMHDAGNRGRCIFRPVVFVDIYDQPVVMPTCPRIISGTIQELITEGEEDPVVVGFEMQLAIGTNEKQPVTVMIEQAMIFDGNGNLVNPDDLQMDDPVNVRGRLNSDGELDAYLVMVGDVAMVSGTAMGSVDDTGVFQLDPDDNQIIVDAESPLSVQVLDGAFVMVGCDDEADIAVIKVGMQAMVLGKLDTKGKFLAVLVVLRPEEISGSLLGIEAIEGGNVLTLDINPDDTGEGEIEIFLPQKVLPHIKGDGRLPMSLLMDLVACEDKPQVEITVETEESSTASELAVVPFELSGEVIEGEVVNDNLITVDIEGSNGNITIRVFEFVTIIDQNGSLISIEDIVPGDKIVSHGLELCDDDATQFSFVISVGEAEMVPFIK